MAKKAAFKTLTTDAIADNPHPNFEIFSEIWKRYPRKADAWYHIQEAVIKVFGWSFDGEDLLLYGRAFTQHVERGYLEQYVGRIFLAMPGLVFFDGGDTGGILDMDKHADGTSSLRVHQFQPSANTVFDIEIVGRSGKGRFLKHKFEQKKDCSAYIKLPGDREVPDEFLGIDKSRWMLMYPTLCRWFPGLRIV